MIEDLAFLREVPPSTMAWGFVTLSVVYAVFKGVYNLYFHPLRKIPGPKMAALCSWYDFYFDIVRGGEYLWKIEKMHEEYGPIVRINPNEVHIIDPDFYPMIYSGGTRKVNKDVSTVAGFGVPNSVAATVAHAHHRSRRGYMNPYFSKRSIINMEPMIHERITALCGRLEGALNEACVISLDKAFSAMTADIITNRFFGYHYDYLSIPELKFPVRDAFLGVSTIFHVTRFVPWLIKYLKMLPNPVIRLILAPVADLLDLQKEIKKNIRKMQNEKAVDGADKSVIIEALGDEKIPAKERSITRLVDEGQVIIFAGTETSSRALAVGMYYLLSEKSLIEKMRAELATLSDVPDASWTVHQLEHMPFLLTWTHTGVVKESIRLAYGPVTRLPRVATEDVLHYKGYDIAPGYPVSQSTYFVHTNPTLFPEPYKFDPNRWVEAAKQGFPLNNYLVSFTKGSRQCLGINLAHAELYLTLARVVHNFDMDLYSTTVKDVQIHHVLIIGQPEVIKGKGPGQGEVKVKVTKRVLG